MTDVNALKNALPFWLSLGLVPLAMIGVSVGGWTVVLMPLYAWTLITILDFLLGRDEENPDPQTDEADLIWYRAITMLWLPVQLLVIYGTIWGVVRSDHLSILEAVVLMFGVGVASGTIGIVYAHELMHQGNRLERWLGDLLLATVLYSHFRTEHLLVHHRYVGTPRDAVTARYNEGFHRFFWRVLQECPVSAWEAEREKAGQGRASGLASVKPVLALRCIADTGAGAGHYGGWLAGARSVPASGVFRGLAAGTDQLYRTLWTDPAKTAQWQV